ncbi:ScyD/ScyE family protein [Streptomyces sp. NRRL F-5126]|uniref:ScyD/ScyE family protein n=1 Tax=Streptomyces sp. NRRL F-5126 TaxID=1463857 RepID=UPI00131C58B6|nr:ScyD/ScyE family protein [Streptomyces sp. NRRL F-5126]
MKLSKTARAATAAGFVLALSSVAMFTPGAANAVSGFVTGGHRSAVTPVKAVIASNTASTLVSRPAAGRTRPAAKVLARGLDAPKYVALHPDGVYVAESGSGGPHCVTGVANISVTHVCAGSTGSVVRVANGHVHTLERGLASASVASTHGVSGVTDIGFSGGRMAVLFDDGGVGPTGVSGIASPYGAKFGKLDLAESDNGGCLTTVADIAAFQATHPQSPAALGGLPGETLYDADPHAMAAYKGGFAVADAAANNVLWVHGSGKVTLLGRLPTRPERAPAGSLGPGTPATTINAQAVPSSVAVGPDGALYVGLLRGAPAVPGTAEVDRIVPGHAPQPVVTGLTRVSDVAFDSHGRLDILESSTAGGGDGTTSAGALLRASVHGSTPVKATDLGVPGLNSPVGLAIGKTGTAYITNNTATVGKGQLIAVTGLK